MKKEMMNRKKMMKNNMEKEDAIYVLDKIHDEGFHYCFNSYSRFSDIKDEEFHRLRLQYLNSIEELQNYLSEQVEK